MKVAKWHFSLIILIFLAFLANIAYSQQANIPTMHVLLIIADADPSIGRAVEVDRQRMEGMLKVASSICRVKTQTLLSSRNELKSEPIMQWFKSLNPDANDTILIYYSGHGGMNKNKETFFYLQDGYFWRSKMSNELESVKKCRLKMLITDCCSDGPETEAPAFKAVISQKALQDLFLKHEGYLHITAATEGEYSWCSPKYGGWFTRAMVDSFDDSSDTNMDGFVSWEEVFALTRDAVQKKYRQSLPVFTKDMRDDMAKKGITSQTPKFYSMAKRAEPKNIQAITTDSGKKPSLDQIKIPSSNLVKETLWDIKNINSSFNININTDKPRYSIGENVVFRISSTADCYIILFNWNSKGEPIQLYPNKYESSNFAVKGKEYSLPSLSDPKYDFCVSGSKGEERIKIIALRNRPDNQKLRSLIPLDDGCGSGLSQLTVVPRKTITSEEIEAKIIDAIRMMNPSDWATANYAIQLK